LEAPHSQISHFKIPNRNGRVEAASRRPCAVRSGSGLARKGWVELFASEWAWWASHTGTIGIAAGTGTTTCVVCNISHLCSRLDRCLTTALDMRYQHRDSDLRRSSSRSFDRSGGRFPGHKRDAAIYSLAIGPNCVHVYHPRFAGWAALATVLMRIVLLLQ
jgi:hypothetical protein